MVAHSHRAVLVAILLASSAAAQPLKHPDPLLHSIYPAGGCQGQTVEIELSGLAGMLDATGLLIEGAPGITVRKVQQTRTGKTSSVTATLVIAADASPGRRLIRASGCSGGLSNARPFFVSRLAEVLEKEPNNTPDTAQEITLPVVVNGRIDPTLDVDCYAFRARAGQKIVASILAHGMDTLLKGGKLGGFLDTSLELLDDRGRVVASAEDTIGLDPVLNYTTPAEGRYVLRVQSLFFKGSPTAVYRLTVGDVPCPTHVFPPGGQRGTKTAVEFQGINMPANAKQTVTIPAECSPWRWLAFDHPLSDGRELPFIAGDFPERSEKEPNSDREKAERLTIPATVNGRIDTPGDHDWYRVSLRKGQGILLEVTAQRHLRSAVDSLVEIYDTTGTKLAENDDGVLFGQNNPCAHDFPSSDSWLSFKAPKDDDYFIRVSDQGDASGPAAVYRLSVSPLQPDFQLNVWPDAVPIWGPGVTSSLIVHMQFWGGLNSDIKLRIEGLPEGWTGSVVNIPATGYLPFGPPNGFQALMTITAPMDAAPGAIAPFRVIGRAEQGKRVIEREAMPMSLYGGGPSKRMHLRYTPQAYAAVGASLGVRLEPLMKELTVKMGETIEVPVRIHRLPGGPGDLSISIDGPLNGGGAACAWRVPVLVKADQTEVKLPLIVAGKRLPGTYGIMASRSWASDLRVARPGPCTPIITINVLPAK